MRERLAPHDVLKTLFYLGYCTPPLGTSCFSKT
jgi:hypothetical protein